MSIEEQKPAPEPTDEFTKEANILADFWMRRLTGDGWKILSCVVRKAWGWHHAEAFISLNEFIEMTGLPTKTVVLRGIQECVYMGALAIGKQTDKDGSKSYFIPESALGGTTLVPPNPRKKKRKGHAPGTRMVHAGVPSGYQEGYQPGTPPGASVVPDLQRLPVARSAPQEAPQDTKQEAKDTSLKKVLNKEKDIPPQALPSAGASLRSRRVDDVEKEENKTTTRDADQPSPHSRAERHTIPAKQGDSPQAIEQGQEPPSIAERWWQRVREEMQARVSITAWRSSIEATKGLRQEGSVLIVQVKGSAAREALEGRHKREIEHILLGVTGREISVQYTQEEG